MTFFKYCRDSTRSKIVYCGA